MSDPMHPGDMLKKVSKEFMDEINIQAPSSEVAYALVEALMREDPRAKLLIEQLVAARSALMLYLRNGRGYEPRQLGPVLGWCHAMSNRYCWDGQEDGSDE